MQKALQKYFNKELILMDEKVIIETDRLILKAQTMEEQYYLWIY